MGAALIAAAAVSGPGAARADASSASGQSFLETFDGLDKERWYVSNGWSNGAHQNCTWSRDRIGLEDGVLKLGFAKQQTGDLPYACAEIQTRQRYGYGTYEARIKAVGASGFNTGFFTFIGPVDKQPHDEIDFEVLGKDPSQVQLNQYVDGKGGNEKLTPVPGGADAGFNDYAFVWEEDRITWYINGERVHVADDPTKLPSHASKIFLSLWSSDTMTAWMGPFAEPEGPLAAEVDRISFTAPGDDCLFAESVACRAD
nr:family 16 glycosylhydrolase [Mesorhizobium xinjiangense]